MVGPFMQGMLLIGIIYWYSKSMMSLINDYYRSEFSRKLQSAAKPAEQAPINVDNFMDYVRQLDEKSQPEQQQWVQSEPECSIKPELGQSFSLLRFMQITGTYPAPDFCTLQRTAADSSIS